MRKSTALSQSVAQEAALSAQLSAKDELKQVMEEQRLQLQREKDNFVMQVSEFMNLYIFKYMSACVYTLYQTHCKIVILLGVYINCTLIKIDWYWYSSVHVDTL